MQDAMPYHNANAIPQNGARSLLSVTALGAVAIIVLSHTSCDLRVPASISV